jgi:hypothetical protein
MKIQNKSGIKLSFKYLAVVFLILTCSVKIIAQITVDPGNSRTICAADSTILGGSPTANGGMPPYTYSWSPNTGLNSTTVSNPSAAPNVTTTYTITVNDLMMIPSTATVTVTVDPAPAVNAGADLINCVGASINFSPSVAGGITYLWNFGDGNTSTLLNPSHSYATTGTFPVSLSVGGSSGCNASDTLLVTIEAPILSLTSTNASCNGLCDGTGVVTTSAGFAPFNYLWSNGTTTSNTSGLCAGTYTTTVTDAIGCTSTSTVTIIEPAAITAFITTNNVSCNGACNGLAAISPTGGSAPYVYYWLPGSQTTQTVTGLCAGMIISVVTDMNGCTGSDTTFITEPAPLIVTTTPLDTICSNTSTNISGTVAGGIPPYTYNWTDQITTISTLPFVSVNPVANTIYILTITDGSGCSGAATDTVIVSPNTNIDGQVTYSGGILSSGINRAVLFRQQSVLVAFDTVQTTTLDASGYYHFTAVDQGDYLIKVFPDTSVFGNMVPTYYGNEYLWDSALTITHGCSVSNIANILMVEGGTGSGPGNLTGHISEGDGFGRAPGDPVPGIDIKLGRNPGGLFSNTQTDSNGDYSFTGIPVNAAGEKYVVYVDIPGIGRDSSYVFTVTGSNNQFNNLDYYVDSAFAHPVYNTTVGINDHKTEVSKFNIYPNPATETATIEYQIASESKVKISVYNVLGVKLIEVCDNKQSAGNYKYSVNVKNNNLNPGVYLISMEINGKISIQRLVITK